MKNCIHMMRDANDNNEPTFIIRAKDKHSIMLLEKYLEECQYGSSPEKHIKEIQQILLEFKEWQKENFNSVKDPD